jgi:hypothetical protein
MNPTDLSDIKAAVPPEALARGATYIINLSVLRAETGALWSSLVEGVHLRLETACKRALAPQDYFANVDELRYLVAINAGQPSESAEVVLRIAYELTIAILGSCEPRGLSLERVEGYGNGDLISSPIRPDELARIAQGVDASQRTLPAKSSEWSEEGGKRKKRVPHRDGITIHHHFEPIWDCRHEAITTYMCCPERVEETDGVGTKTLDISDLTQQERTTLDLSCIAHGVRSLSRGVEIGDRFVLALPVGFETLSAPLGRTEFVRLCRGLPAAYRPYLLFMLTGVPLGVAQSRLADLIALIRPFGRLVASVAPGCRNFNAYQGQGLSGVFLDCATLGQQAQRSTTDIVHLAAASRSARISSMVCGITDVSVANQAHAADIHYLHGSAIAEPVAAPRRMSYRSRSIILPSAESEVAEEWF